jgi:hypothetical protein
MATWAQDADSTGTNRNVCFQALANECGACCVAMIVRAAAGKNLDASTARAEIFKYEKEALVRDGLHRSFDESSAALALWSTHGCLTSSYAQALSAFGVKGAYGGSRVTGAVDLRRLITSRTSLSKPGLVTVSWVGGGGHAVVVMGTVGVANNILILDPGFGVQEVPQVNLPAYAPVPTATATASAGTVGAGNGNFKWEIVTTA